MTQERTRKPASLEPSGAGMTPMIDVTFLLLIFFLCTLRFASLEGLLPAHLPRSGGQDPEPALRVEPIDVAVELVAPGTRVVPAGHPRAGAAWSGEGRFDYAPGTRVVRYRLGPRRHARIADLRAALLPLRDAERPLRLSAGEGTVWGDVAPVVDLVKLLEFEELTLAPAPRR
jgi:biopolymer transport protein ExbD